MGWKYHTGFESEVFARFDESASGITPSIETGSPNSGVRHFRETLISNRDWTPTSSFAEYTADSVGDGLVLGLALRFNELALSETLRFMFIMDGSSSSNSYVGFEIGSDGAVSVEGGNASDLNDFVYGTAPAGTIVNDEWYDFELFWEPDTSSGTVKLAINGAVVVEATGIDTWPGTNGGPVVGYGWLLWAGTPSSLGASTFEVDIDDFRIGDGFADLQGPMRHELLVPTSDIETDPTPVGSASHFENVDEIPASDADYNDFTVAGDRGRYGLSDRSETGDVAAVSVFGTASDPGSSATLRLLLEEGGTEVESGDLVLSATAGTRYDDNPRDVNPRTGLAWTTADINNMTAGARRVT